MNEKITRSVAAAAFVCSAWSTAYGQPFEGNFRELRVGESRATVLALMGEPTAQVEASILGIPRTEIRWFVGGRTYVIEFVMDRLFSKRVCQAVPNC